MYPSVDGSYNERKAKGCIVPRNRWIDNLTSRSACDALRHTGREFLNDPEMEFYVRCTSGHTRQVDLQSFGRPLWSGLAKKNRTTIFQQNPFLQVRILQDEGAAQAKYRVRRPAPHPVKKRERSSRSRRSPMFHATYGELLISIMENGLKSGKSQSNPSGECTSTWHASTTLSSTTKRQKQH